MIATINLGTHSKQGLIKIEITCAKGGFYIFKESLKIQQNVITFL